MNSDARNRIVDPSNKTDSAKAEGSEFLSGVSPAKMNNPKLVRLFETGRGAEDRVFLAAFCTVMAFAVGVGYWAMLDERQNPSIGFSKLEALLVEDFLLTIFALCVCTIFWAMFTPRWIERIVFDLFLKIGIAWLILVAAVVIFAALGLVLFLLTSNAS